MTAPLFHTLRKLARPAPAIGVDVDNGVVRMLQVEAEADLRPRVVAMARGSVAAYGGAAAKPVGGGGGLDPREAEVVTDLLRRGGFRGRRVVVAVPQAMMQFRTLRVPAADDPGELSRLLAREAKEALGVDLTRGQHLVHFLPGDPLRRGGDAHREGLLVVVRRNDVDGLVAAYHDCGATVAGVDLRPMALYRGLQRFNRRRRDGEDVHVLVHLGRRATQVVIGRGGRMSFLKAVSIGTDALHEAVARKLGLDADDAADLCQSLLAQRPATGGEPAASRPDPVQQAVAAAMRPAVENLGRELSLCLRYYCVTFQCKRPERILLCGPQAEDARLLASLGERLLVPVEARRPLEDLEVDARFAAAAAGCPEEWDVATGLALRHAPSSLAGRAGLSRLAQAAADVEAANGDDAVPRRRRSIDPAPAANEPSQTFEPREEAALHV